MVETILQRKILEHEKLQREINALRLAVKLAKDAAKNSDSGAALQRTQASSAA